MICSLLFLFLFQFFVTISSSINAEIFSMYFCFFIPSNEFSLRNSSIKPIDALPLVAIPRTKESKSTGD